MRSLAAFMLLLPFLATAQVATQYAGWQHSGALTFCEVQIQAESTLR